MEYEKMLEQELKTITIFRGFKIFSKFNNCIYNISENLDFGGAYFALK